MYSLEVGQSWTVPADMNIVKVMRITPHLNINSRSHHKQPRRRQTPSQGVVLYDVCWEKKTPAAMPTNECQPPRRAARLLDSVPEHIVDEQWYQSDLASFISEWNLEDEYKEVELNLHEDPSAYDYLG